MRAGIVRVSYEHLENMLKLPDGMTILRVSDDVEFASTVLIRVTGPTCPEIQDHEQIPWIEVPVPA